MAGMSRQALYEAAWDRPLTAVAAELGITSTGLKKICDRYEIPTPRRGYWAQVRAGKVFKRPPLRPTKNSALDEIHIVGTRPQSPAVSAAIAKARAFAANSPARSSPRSDRDKAPPQPSPGESSSSDVGGLSPSLRKELERTQKAISRARVGESGFGSAFGTGIISIIVSPAMQQAALSFLSHLLNLAGQRGWKSRLDADGSRLLVEDEPVTFRLEEQSDKTPHRPTDKERQAKKERDRWGGDSQPWPTWDYHPAGRLALLIDGNNYSGLRRTYSQRKGHTFEESADVILAGFAAHAAYAIEQRCQRQERAEAAARAEVRRQRLEAFAHREKRRGEFVDAVAAALAERDKLKCVLAHLEGAPPTDRKELAEMRAWLARRLQVLDERLGPMALDISARSSKLSFREPPGDEEASRWYAPAIKLELWLPAAEEGMVHAASELDWAIVQGLIVDPGTPPE